MGHKRNNKKKTQTQTQASKNFVAVAKEESETLFERQQPQKVSTEQLTNVASADANAEDVSLGKDADKLSCDRDSRSGDEAGKWQPADNDNDAAAAAAADVQQEDEENDSLNSSGKEEDDSETSEAELIKQLHQQISEVEREIAEENQKHTRDIQALHEETQSYQRQIQEAEAQLETQRAHKSNLEAELELVNREVERLKNEMDASTADCNTQLREIRRLEDEIEDQKNQLARIAEESEALKPLREDLLVEMRTLKKEQDEFQKKKSDHDAKCKSLQEEKEKLEGNITWLTDSIAKANSAMDAINADTAAFEQQKILDQEKLDLRKREIMELEANVAKENESLELLKTYVDLMDQINEVKEQIALLKANRQKESEDLELAIGESLTTLSISETAMEDQSDDTNKKEADNSVSTAESQLLNGVELFSVENVQKKRDIKRTKSDRH